MKKRADELSFHSRLASTLVLVLMVALFLLLVAIITLRNDRLTAEQKELDTLALQASAKIEKLLTLPLERIRPLVSLMEQGNAALDDFPALAAALCEGIPALTVFIAPNGVVEQVYPKDGNEEVIGWNCVTPEDPASLHAMVTGLPAASGPARNADGAWVVSGRLPVYVNGVLWGIVGAEMHLAAILDHVMLDDPVTRGFVYRLWPTKKPGQEQALLWQSAGEAAGPGGTAHFTGLGLDWYVEASRKFNFEDMVNSWLYIAGMVLVCLLVAALGYHYLNLRGIKTAMESQAMTDNMTGLANRRSIMTSLNGMIAEAEEAGDPLTILYMDLNNFKTVNDVHGHGTGDEVLRRTASILRDNAKDLGVIGRLGGDEFVILLEKIAPGRMLDRIVGILSGKLHMAVTRHGDRAGPEVEVSASFGISSFPRDGADSATLLHAADLDMYQTKKRMKGSTQIGPFKNNFRQ